MANVNLVEKNEDLIVDNLKYVKGLVKHVLANYGYDDGYFNDCYSAASLALVEAYKKFDPNSGYPFKSFFYLRVRGAVIDCIRRLTSATGRYSKATTKKSIKCHEHNVKQVAVQNEFTDEFTYDYYDCDVLNPEENTIEVEVKGLMGQVLADMPLRDRMVLVHYYIDGMTFEQIANTMDITRGWVSRVHKKALEMAREAYAERSNQESCTL